MATTVFDIPMILQCQSLVNTLPLLVPHGNILPLLIPHGNILPLLIPHGMLFTTCYNNQIAV